MAGGSKSKSNDSSNDNNDNTTTPKRRNQRNNNNNKATREDINNNAHTSVLGMDGTDMMQQQVPPATATGGASGTNGGTNGNAVAAKRTEDVEQQGNNSAYDNVNNRDEDMLPGSRTSWWGKVWEGSSYNQVAPQPSQQQQRHHRPTDTARYAPDSLMDPPSSSSENHNNNNNNNNDTSSMNTTVEDQLRQDCHFFYQGLDDHQPSPDRRRRLRPFSSNRTATSMTNNTQEGGLFYAKYHRLNQEMTGRQLDNHHHHDLQLEEEDLQQQQQQQIRFHSDNSINVLDTQHSSLFYEQDGKLLMKLPRDQMRLMMDNDLEPGIISVLQWRKADDEFQGLTAVPQMEMTPPLKYVLTVPDDLYRRVVSEMSYRLMPPYWGFFKCCHYHDDTEHADIRLALAILAVTFTLVFAFTMEWRTE